MEYPVMWGNVLISTRGWVGVVFLAVCLGGCGSSGTHVGARSLGSGSGQTARLVAQGSRLTATHDVFSLLLSRSKDLGPLPTERRIGFVLLLRDPTAAKRARDLRNMYDPHSKTFGHYINPKEFARQYGPSPKRVGVV